MTQLMIIENNPADFDSKLNSMLSKGFKIVPGTTYVSHVEHVSVLEDKNLNAIPYFFVVLSTKCGTQLSVSATNSKIFHTEVNKVLKDGGYVVPGTIYATTMRSVYDVKKVEPILSVTIEKDCHASTVD